MSLSTGLYIIQNGDNIIDRRFAEDRSLLPKTIVLSPTGSNSTWVFEKSDNGSNEYIIKSYGSPTAHIENNVFAILMNVSGITNWIVEPVPQHGENSYMYVIAMAFTVERFICKTWIFG
ncbi:serine protease inhibitor [Lentinula novae-zelandiae]|nr:serine protease inhibitor [Lentinula novae-zelandiae]